MTTRLVSCAAITILWFGSLGQASAQVLRTWVASYGSDMSANCTRSSPCRTFAGAMAKTAAKGEIICIDSAGFSPVFIQKSLTIDCTNANGTPGATDTTYGNIGVQIVAGEVVTLRGVNITGLTPFFSQGSGTVIIERSRFNSAQNGDSGIYFLPDGAGKLVVTDTLVTGNGGSAGGAGIRIYPRDGGSAQVTLERVTVAGNQFGIAFDGSRSAAGINGTIKDSTTSSNVNDGVIAVSSSGQAPIGVAVINTASLNNGFGIRSIGDNVTVRVQGSQIIGNTTGFGGGGTLLTGGGNTVQANATNGVFTGSYPLQ